MKKRGLGASKWNGLGGKIDFKNGDKNIINTAIRETEGEIVKKSNIKFFKKYNYEYIRNN